MKKTMKINGMYKAGGVGSNQYQRKYKRAQKSVWKMLRGYFALAIFIWALAYALTLPIYAADSREAKPVQVSAESVEKDAGESAKLHQLEDKVARLEYTMKLQTQLNALNKKWMDAQEVINAAQSLINMGAKK